MLRRNMSRANDSERFKNFVFITPPVMVDNDLQLKLVEKFPYNPEKNYVRAYRFAMIHAQTGDVMGDIELRVALNEKLKRLVCHIGYEVYEPYRGQRYAARSCRPLLPFARKLSINPVVITYDPQNLASVKTIESLGIKLLSTKKVKLEPGVFRWTNVNHLHLDKKSGFSLIGMIGR